MSDSYQAVYDAVRSRIAGCDLGLVVGDVARQCMDMSYTIPGLIQDIAQQFAEHGRPSAVFRPSLRVDGNMWCALYGDNLQDGVAGFGETPARAMEDFDVQWLNAKCGQAPSAERAES